MQVKASLKNYRRSARKVREAVAILRGQSVERAVAQLMVLEKGAAGDLLNLLKSAVANAENNFKIKEEDLYISEIRVNEGPTMKRWRARAHGRAAQILKRTCHVEMILEGEERSEKDSKKVEKKEAKEKKEVKKEKPEVKKEEKKDK